MTSSNPNNAATELVKLRIVCISDTHNAAPGEGYVLPKGDILVHAGDLTNQSSFHEMRKAVRWLSDAQYAVKIVVAGNHDLSLDSGYAPRHEKGWSVIPEEPEKTRQLLEACPDIFYLQHAYAEIEVPGKGVSIRVFGSPYSPEHRPQNWAFQYTDDQAEKLWSTIPPDTDLLITHSPAKGLCDESQHWKEGGCPRLAVALSQVRPLLHVCGHCHEGRGARIVRWTSAEHLAGDVSAASAWEDPSRGSKKQSLLDLTGKTGHTARPGHETAIFNASVMAKSHGRGDKAFNKPIVVDILLPRKAS